ncbi:nuclear transport factor 2 family protein [Candidatus Peregrinibacteria bacterium]|jgi:hypothetical protein|nr:nuclear transport factor 2 family protein [Candidatus Peregrinibacteria bacterium]MBT4631549.1 nuclear transport factor 2 family protein [Candidatus Peregrinibacteria bacterium]MBT5824230.1 nuclear transport factor 2 family protein [Candidatus Peregrinibacteria bacterium]
MKEINEWLSQFTEAWKTHAIDKVLALFSDDLEYWETPFKKITNKIELEKEWQYIKIQTNIQIKCKVFSISGNKYSIFWELKYENNKNVQKELRGIYLIELDDQKKCKYFFHCGESKI